MNSPNPKVLVPVAVLTTGVALAAVLAATGPVLESVQPERAYPAVRVLHVERGPVELRVRTHGSVQPRMESEIMPEIAGTVVWVSPRLVSGGFVEAAEPLLRIDPLDYQVALERARAGVERATSEYERAHRDRVRRERLAKRDVSSAADLDLARTAERTTSAALREARATLEQAERNLARTELRAPYAARVRAAYVGLGQLARPGDRIASLYAIDYFEVRLPIVDEELAYIDPALLYRPVGPPDAASESGPLTDSADEAGRTADPQGNPPPRGEAPVEPVDLAAAHSPEVLLHARFAGGQHTWRGRVVRTEGEIDPKTRMVHVVARVSDPYAPPPKEAPSRPPLGVGLFVEAEILGRRLDSAVVLPRSVLRDGDRVWTLDAEERLRSRQVEVLRMDGDQVVVGAGLKDGDRVCLSLVDTGVEGMKVRPLAAASTAGDAPPGPAGFEPTGPEPTPREPTDTTLGRVGA